MVLKRSRSRQMGVKVSGFSEGHQHPLCSIENENTVETAGSRKSHVSHWVFWVFQWINKLPRRIFESCAADHSSYRREGFLFQMWMPTTHRKKIYSLRGSWEQGCLFSQTFLTLPRPCLPFLFGHNGKFSVPALKICSSRMPSLRPKSLGLPRGDQTKKTYLLF